MKELPKLDQKVRIIGTETLVQNHLKDLIKNKLAIVDQTGTSGSIIVCYFQEKANTPPVYFAIDIKDVELFYPKGKIYIAGQITGLPIKTATDNFKYAEEELKRRGYEAINPMEIEHKEAKEMEDFLKLDISKGLSNSEYDEITKKIHNAVLDCEQVAVLDGWEKSKGANIEVHIAHQYNHKIYSFPSMEIINIL